MSWLSHKKKPKVLLVEDNELQAELTASVIGETGMYDVLIAHNGEEAFVELARHERGFDFLTNEISCILLDWQMPKMDGTQFLRELRAKELKSPFKRHTPVVIVSAYGDNELRLKAEDSSHGLVSAYLTKPIDESELLHVLKRIVFDKEAEIMRELLLEQRLKLQRERTRPAK
ncbi:MAG TPA: response regulator [Candidatus Acidoferrum sp.]|nr:response regulator [Candidatus Acidoferrum sp.]